MYKGIWYYYVSDDGNVYKELWRENYRDYRRWIWGNVFEREEDAIRKRDEWNITGDERCEVERNGEDS